MKKSFLISAVLLVLVLNFGCSKKNDFGSQDGPSTTPTNPGDTPPAKNFFWVHHKAVTGALRYTHKVVSSGSWPDQCKVDLDSTDPTARDIMCITESSELDLMSQGLTLDYNVPAHAKCPYITTMAPFFFQWEPPRYDSATTPNIPPRYVVVEDDKTTGQYRVHGFYDINTYNSANPINTWGTANSHISNMGGAYRCQYNYSEVEGPNCCSGDYTEIQLTTNYVASGTQTTISQSVKNWGGDPSFCLNGPALKLNENTSGKSKWPVVKVWRMSEQVEAGATLVSSAKFFSPVEIFSDVRTLAEETPEKGAVNFGSLEVKSLFDDLKMTTRYLSSYYSSAQPPKAFSDILNYYDAGFYAQNGDPRYFTFLCADTSHEITARIRLSVREWDTAAALKLATEPTSNEDDNTGAETDYPEYPNQDYFDWEDTDPDSWQSDTFNGYPGAIL